MCWHRRKSFNGCKHVRRDVKLCMVATPAMRESAGQGFFFPASCQSVFARHTFMVQPHFDLDNCCTFLCCVRVVTAFETYVRQLEHDTGIPVAQRDLNEAFIQGREEHERDAIRNLRKARENFLVAAKMHWNVCGIHINPFPVEPNAGIRTPSRLQLGLDMIDFTVQQQHQEILGLFAPEIALLPQGPAIVQRPEDLNILFPYGRLDPHAQNHPTVLNNANPPNNGGQNGGQ